MNEVTMIGVDLAKSVIQAHGATAAGEPVFEVLKRAAKLRGCDGGLCLLAFLEARAHEAGP